MVNCCDRIHLGFGTLISIFEKTEFHFFCQYISKQYDTYYSKMLVTGEKLFLQTDSERLLIALSTDELKSLYCLINEAAIMLEVQQLLF